MYYYCRYSRISIRLSINLNFKGKKIFIQKVSDMGERIQKAGATANEI